MGILGDKKTLRRPIRNRDDIIEIDLQKMECGRMDCIGLVQDREMGKLGGKGTLSKPRLKWDDIIDVDLQEVG